VKVPRWLYERQDGIVWPPEPEEDEWHELPLFWWLLGKALKWTLVIIGVCVAGAVLGLVLGSIFRELGWLAIDIRPHDVGP
jgi:hypothetical protein